MAVAINESRTKDMIVDVNYVRSLGQIAIRSDLNDAAIMYADAPALPTIRALIKAISSMYVSPFQLKMETVFFPTLNRIT